MISTRLSVPALTVNSGPSPKPRGKLSARIISCHYAQRAGPRPSSHRKSEYGKLMRTLQLSHHRRRAARECRPTVRHQLRVPEW